MWHWYSWQVILIILNALLGLAAIEWAFHKMRFFRKPIPELNELMPAYRRDDVEKWARWKFYPGALTILIPRFLFTICLGIILILLLKVMLIC